MNKKILFVLQKFNDPSAQNAICIKGIIDAFEKECFDIDVLSLEYGDCEAVNNYVVRNTFQKVYKKRIFEILHIPLHNKSNINNLYKKAKEIYEERKYDAIIAVSNPTESIEAISRLREIYKFFFVIFEIDPASNRYSNEKSFFKKFWKYKSTKWEKKVFNRADCIFHMKSHRKHFEGKDFSQFRNKTYFVDVPCLNDKNDFLCNFACKDCKDFIYAGAFYKNLREPNYMLKVFDSLLKKTDDKLKIFTRDDYVDLINIEEKKENIVAYNTIPQEELIKKQRECKALVSIGNKESDFLPSKTIQYISTCKPIIHFYYDDNDLSCEYFKKYGNAICIKIGTSVEKACEKIEEFLKNDIQNVTYETVYKRFEENTFAYVADSLMRVINGNSFKR